MVVLQERGCLSGNRNVGHNLSLSDMQHDFCMQQEDVTCEVNWINLATIKMKLFFFILNILEDAHLFNRCGNDHGMIASLNHTKHLT